MKVQICIVLLLLVLVETVPIKQLGLPGKSDGTTRANFDPGCKHVTVEECKEFCDDSGNNCWDMCDDKLKLICNS